MVSRYRASLLCLAGAATLLTLGWGDGSRRDQPQAMPCAGEKMRSTADGRCPAHQETLVRKALAVPCGAATWASAAYGEAREAHFPYGAAGRDPATGRGVATLRLRTCAGCTSAERAWLAASRGD